MNEPFWSFSRLYSATCLYIFFAMEWRNNCSLWYLLRYYRRPQAEGERWKWITRMINELYGLASLLRGLSWRDRRLVVAQWVSGRIYRLLAGRE